MAILAFPLVRGKLAIGDKSAGCRLCVHTNYHASICRSMQDGVALARVAMRGRGWPCGHMWLLSAPSFVKVSLLSVAAPVMHKQILRALQWFEQHDARLRCEHFVAWTLCTDRERLSFQLRVPRCPRCQHSCTSANATSFQSEASTSAAEHEASKCLATHCAPRVPS